jgi:parvulin-like peptidyl-prolyl isomerase
VIEFVRVSGSIQLLLIFLDYFTKEERMKTPTKIDTLIAVNNDLFDVKEAIRRSIIHDEDKFLDISIEEMIVRQYAAQNGIINSDDELQIAADEHRYQRGLESVEKIYQWLEINHQTIVSMQNGIDIQLLRNKVRNSIPDREIAAYFAEHQLEFDRVDLYSIRLDDEDKANELYASITEDGADFHLLAMKYSVDEDTKLKAGYVGRMSRNDLSGDIAAEVFNAQAGEVVGPLKTEKGYNLFKVAAIYPSKLEKERDSIQFSLFLSLLARLRSEATIAYPILEENS